MSASLYDYPDCHVSQSQKNGISNGPYGASRVSRLRALVLVAAVTVPGHKSSLPRVMLALTVCRTALRRRVPGHRITLV
jgi:hypothetical protein